MITVAVDAGGADLGPREVAAGAGRAAAAGIRVLLFGDAGKIGSVPAGVDLVDAPISIAKQADPANAVRTTPQASIVQATRAVAEGHAQAFVSGGSTGPALAAALFNLRRDRGVYRPALALQLPNPGKSPVLLLDVGANVICRPEHLVQFAHMGSAFAQAVIGVESPRVALLSNGEEPGKGTPDLVSVHEQLVGDRGAGLNFIGNVEGTQVPEGVADVVVMDGFTGNVTLKLMEGVSSRALRLVTETAGASARGRLGHRLIAPSLRRLHDEIDPESQGGAYMLGLRQLGVVAHGRFGARGFARAIEVAARGVEQDVIGRTRAALEVAGAMRPPRPGAAPAARDPDGSSATTAADGSSATAATDSSSATAARDGSSATAATVFGS